MSVALTYTANLTAVETLEDNVPAAAATKRRVTHDQFDTTSQLNAATTPPVTKVAAFQQALTAGAATVDLTSLTGTNGASVDGTGLRVQAMKLRNPSTNSGNITVAQGAANGYDGFGASFSLTLAPGAEMMILTDDAGTDIGATNSDLDLSGTGTEALDMEIVLG